MPKLPWKTITQVDPETELTVMASRLPLRNHRHIPGFMAAALRIRRQLARSEGLAGYALDAQLGAKTFWTVSAWTSRDELMRFDRADPHHSATRAIKPNMDPSTFVFWTVPARELPVSWGEVQRRVAERQPSTASSGPDVSSVSSGPDVRSADPEAPSADPEAPSADTEAPAVDPEPPHSR